MAGNALLSAFGLLGHAYLPLNAAYTAPGAAYFPG
jgi:hypothetical protein